MLKIYNTMTRQKEVFTPLEEGHVKIYTCGQTVYDDVHIGNARTYSSWDVIIRYLRYKGYNVFHVQNFTDVGHLTDDADQGEDKIEKRAKEQKINPWELVDKQIEEYWQVIDDLNINRPNISPRATSLIPEMIELIQILLEKLHRANKIAFMGIGEEKLRDDAVGVYIISELLEYSNEKFLFINAGIDPMNRIDEIVEFQASHLVLLDTCTLNKPPGTVSIIERVNIKEYVPISSHTLPVHVVVDLLLEKLPNLQVFMIGFVPESLEGFTELKLYKESEYSLEERSESKDLPFFEFNLTKTMQKAADQVIKIIKKIILN